MVKVDPGIYDVLQWLLCAMTNGCDRACTVWEPVHWQRIVWWWEQAKWNQCMLPSLMGKNRETSLFQFI